MGVRRGWLSEAVALRTIYAVDAPRRRPSSDDRTAANGPLPERRRSRQAARPHEGRAEPEHRAAGVRVLRWLLGLPLRDDARGPADPGGQRPRGERRPRL